ncbi:N-acylneuraminate cytidylyltransferase [Bordetella ansorpii]|uniref:N-acylneuraminate cytidylyltransferase n=1 Tax=Bordetella ansorpii TaxID=288768 RepID=A0A157SWW5_9BORD|nr:acylneuraminate cytidylyltransferase family protein [Bordetella ansorpii]SAI74831.1 N-acylneuraminate cytidylyltransferase [Bordetella ansorpii]
MRNVLALVPARGGSRRVPRKNVLPLGGLPLIGWSIRAALRSGICKEVRVSTDDAEIAEVARSLGASVPTMRPAELATDLAGSVEVALHELALFEAEHGPADGLLLLQPTSPFRGPDAISQAWALFRSHGGTRPVVSVSPAASHPAWTFRMADEGMSPVLGWDALAVRSQDLEAMWTLNGSLYLISPDRLRRDRRFLTQDVLPFPMTAVAEGVDIDTWLDWHFAESVLAMESITPPLPV